MGIAANVFDLMKAGRSRWKIENEIARAARFNTLKNQGYHFEHTYGHGYQHLSNVFAHLMLLAFLTDQVIERCSQLFHAIRRGVVTKLKLWFCVRAAFTFKEYSNFRDIYVDIGRQFSVQLE